MIKIKKGLDIPISGAPSATVEDAPAARSVALVGYDYVGMKPTMLVREGDRVITGQPVFEDKKTPGVVFTAPATGTVSAVNRGAKRVFESLVIDVEADEYVEFASYASGDLAGLSEEQVRKNLQDSGLWTALRTRPLSKVPAIDSTAASIFVNAMDTNPLAADPAIVIAENEPAFLDGITVLTRLCPKLFLVSADGSAVPRVSLQGVTSETFAGPHPAGLVGTHIHHLDPVHADKTVWSVDYQDVIAIGQLFTSGKLPTSRVVALGGPQVENPRLLRTRIGANLEELTAGQLKGGENRVISGSVLSGRTAAGALNFLGRYHNQVSVILEGREREFFGWFSPGMNKHSNMSIYLSSFFGKGKRFDMTSSTNGSERAIVPIGTFERVMPLDILPTQLLRAIVVSDIATAQDLGVLELDEEDLALCTYVCPGKYEYGRILRDNLTLIEKEA
jgi:Na+-transporting NADH:ubiquinone oxidoreductase subunit A